MKYYFKCYKLFESKNHDMSETCTLKPDFKLYVEMQKSYNRQNNLESKYTF